MKFSCKFCPINFTYGYNLKLHENIHRGDKKYSCDICEKKFVQHFNLKASMKIIVEFDSGSGKIEWILTPQCKVHVSMGAVVALAPIVFESLGASTHGFWQPF